MNALLDILEGPAGEVIASTATISLPVAGNVLLPGAGYVIGAAVGGVVAEMVTGDINNLGDVARAAMVGGAGALVGGAVGRSLAGRLVEQRIADLRRYAVWGSLPDQTFRRALWTAEGTRWGHLAGSLVSHHLFPLVAQGGDSVIDTMDIGAGTMLRGMPDQLLMPGPAVLSKPIEDAYRAMVPLLVGAMQQLGAEEPVSPPQRRPAVLRAGEHSGIPEYEVAADRIRGAIDDLHHGDQRTADLVGQAQRAVAAAQDAIVGVINYLNSTAPRAPLAGMTQDDWTALHLQQATEAVRAAILDATRSSERIRGEITQVAVP
ncbi:hypothetical protein [Nocardia brasiliensis]|uniref:hypothetical protein n=1 Tax=Nocardia brasiliensis TaxID=37326 RepID=UPI003D8FC38F